MRSSLWFMGQVPARVKKSFNRICVPLVPSTILICFFPDLPSPNHRALNLILWVSVGEKWVSLAASAQVGNQGSLTTLPFPCQEDSGLLCSKFCHLAGKSNAGKVPLTHTNASRLIIFFKLLKWSAGTSLETWVSTKSPSSVCICMGGVSQVLLYGPELGWASSQTPVGSTACPEVCLLPNGEWVRAL